MKGWLEAEIVGAVTLLVTLTLLFTILGTKLTFVTQLSHARSSRTVQVSSLKDIPGYVLGVSYIPVFGTVPSIISTNRGNLVSQLTLPAPL